MRLPSTRPFRNPRFNLWLALTALAVWLSGCALVPDAKKPKPPAPPQAVAPLEPQPTVVSRAITPRDYRRDGAEHIYQLNQDRIYHGKLPPLLKAVGVVRVNIDHLGRIQSIEWLRMPSGAPDVVAEIERTLRAAEPFPAPLDMGQVAYTDVWLWHKSGLFQLDTLTEGQTDRSDPKATTR